MQKNKAGKASSESLTQQAYHRISLDIRNCTLQPGSEVSEGEIADSLGMSKTPVREDRVPRRGVTEAGPPRISGLAGLVSVRGLPAG
ncbi:GntR family transcriptional regulator [Devosia sp. MC521]|nr:GntR family transcriptional regulator [Devosia sp. MC521]QMW61994.1 GntR family transcriptional regulator [Devosia sp. MC521]